MLLITDQDARNLICPMSMNTEDAKFCQGEGCMAWQWEDMGQFGGKAIKGFCGMVPTGGMSKIQTSIPCY